MHRVTILPGLCLLVLVRCAGPEQRPVSPAAGPAPEIAKQSPVVTDRARYVLTSGPYGPQATIVATFRAPAERAVYLINCNGATTPGLQRREGERWVNAWVAETNGCFASPIVVAAGTTHTETMTVVSRAEAPDPAQRTGMRITSGTYRVVLHNVLASFNPAAPQAPAEELPIEERVSAPITIEAPGSAPRP